MIPLDRFIDHSTRQYLGIERTLERLSPVSESGRILARNLKAYGPADLDLLAEHHKRLATAIAAFNEKPDWILRLRYHLRELPRLDELWSVAWSFSEGALAKRFLYHHGRLRAVLIEKGFLDEWFRLHETSELDGATLGSAGTARFYIENTRSKELAELRQGIEQLDTKIDDALKKQRESLSNRYNIVSTTDQWIVDRENRDLLDALMKDPEILLVSESIGSLRFSPMRPSSCIKLDAERAKLLQEEQTEESRLITNIEKTVLKRAEKWQTDEAILARLDLLLAQAELSASWHGESPILSGDNSLDLEIIAGKHELIREEVEQADHTYTALDIKLSGHRAVLTGSNMGGKTVALQTVGWLQALSQLGFFVPAKRFEAVAVSAIASSSPIGETVGGLSGFGREIERLASILPRHMQNILYLLDEPAKTTRVKEGTALLKAILAHISEGPSRMLIATHHDGLSGEGIEGFAMRGLDRKRIEAFQQSGEQLPQLHELMDYHVVSKAKKKTGASDALVVAELLGLDRDIVIKAREFLQIKGNK